MDPVDIIDAGPVIRFGLHLNLPGAAEQVHVIDIVSAKRGLQRLEDGRWINLEDLRLVPVDIQIDRRCVRREGAEHAAQARILVGGDQQAAQHLRKRLRRTAPGILQDVTEPATGSEADDRRRSERYHPCAPHLAEFRAASRVMIAFADWEAPNRSPKGFNDTIRKAALGWE